MPTSPFRVLNAFVVLLVSSAAMCVRADDARIAIPTTELDEPAMVRAEQLFTIAQSGKLDDALAAEAAELLKHSDPFVAGIAEWAIATRINRENNGEKVVWPKKNSPNWCRQWQSLSDVFQLQCDYVRQGAVWGVHHSASNLTSSINKILVRAEGAARDACARHADKVVQQAIQDRLTDLRQLHTEAKQLASAETPDLTALRAKWLRARRTAREVALANPAANFRQLLFVTRHPALFANITGSQYPWSHKPGGDICIRDGLRTGATVRPLVNDRLGPGHVHGVDLWWAGDRVVFGWASQPSWPPPWDTISGNNVFRLRGDQPPTHLYEIGLDGSPPRQLTDDPYWSDFEPTYCADGTIVFASDRSGRSSECGKFSADHTVINLYRVDSATGAVQRLNDNKDIDRYPHSLDNGLIAYTRWDYQERHFMETHAIWTVRPDGTMADAVFNQHLVAPYGLRDVRSVPDGDKLVAVATGHHTLAYGPIVVIDPSCGVNNDEAIQIITPRVRPQEGPMSGRPVSSGGPPDRGGTYQTPWALSDTCLLAAYSYSSSRQANGFGIYLIDAFGNKELIHRERYLSCCFPMPLRPRPKPPQLPVDHRNHQQQYATCYLNDVYQGLEGVPRGTVKYLRISQHIGWPLDAEIGAMRYIPGNAWEFQFGHWTWAPVRVIGEVPIHDDGSAHFRVPIDAGVYFQLLDENHMEVRRMRSHVTLQAGEMRGCVGCHETQARAPQTIWKDSQALSQEAELPEPPSWGADRLLGYEWMIQPILDQHCVRCHGSETPEGGLNLTGVLADDGFLRSFHTLFDKPSGKQHKLPLVSIIDRRSNSSVTKPLQVGSHRSRLIQVLLDDPLHRNECSLPDDQWKALVTWVDANAPYYDRFFNRRPTDRGAPRRNVEAHLEDPLANFRTPDTAR